MKRLLATIASMSLVPTAVLIPGVAWSSACNEEIVVEIHMAAGEQLLGLSRQCHVVHGQVRERTDC
jgi:hypothetical protein